MGIILAFARTLLLVIKRSKYCNVMAIMMKEVIRQLPPPKMTPGHQQSLAQQRHSSLMPSIASYLEL
jgi:hypothetical protein